MSRQRGPLLLLILCAVIAVSGGYASTIQDPAIRQAPAFYGAAALRMRSTIDSWLGGTGDWSDPAYWSGGLPGTGSDVYINNGDDLVYLDTNATIASLTLGGTTGSSELSSVSTTYYLIIAGALAVNQTGTLSLDTGDTVAAGMLSVNSGTINLDGRSTLQIYGDASNSGSIDLGYKSGSNGLNVNGMLTNQGILNLNAGDTANIGGLVNSGSVNLYGRSTLQIYGDASNSGSILSPDPSGSNRLTVNGMLTNQGGLVLFGGDTANVGSLVNSGGIGLDNHSTLSINGDASNSGSISVHAASFYSQGKLTNSVGATLELLSGGSAYAASLVNDGSIDLANQSMLSVGNFYNGGRLTTNGLGDYLGISTLRNVGSFSLGAIDKAFVSSLMNSGSIEVVGGWMESGNVINTGTISLVRSGLPGAYSHLTMASLVNSGNLEVGGQEFSSVEINGDAMNSGTIETTQDAFGNRIAISGRLTNGVNGIFFLNGANGANIGTLVNQGTVSLAGPSSSAIIGSVVNQGTMSLAGYGATLNVTGGPTATGSALAGFTNTGIVNISQNSTLSSPSNYIQLAGQTTVDGNLTLSGKGMVVFAGGSVYGNSVLHGYGGTISGPIISNAAINIGDSLKTVGQLFFNGNYTQGSRGSLTFDIAGAELGQYDQLNVTGLAQLDGLMTVDLIHGFLPQIGNTFDIMNFSSSAGKFSLVLGLPINDQEHFQLDYNSTNLELEVVAGQLSESDLGSGPWLASSTAVNPGTALIASAVASQNDTPASTPEPGSFLLLGSGLLCLGHSIRRRMTQ